MKSIITLLITLFSFSINAQDFLYSFNSDTQIINGDSLFVEARIEVSNKSIRIYRDTILSLKFDVNFKKVENKYLDITHLDYRAGFDPIKKVLYIQNKNLNWQIIGK